MKIQFDEITVSTRTRNISVFDGEKDVIINKKDFEKVKTPEGAIPISKWIGNLDKLKITGRTEHKVNSTDLQKETAGKYQDVPAMSFTELQSYNFDPSKKYRVHINQDCMSHGKGTMVNPTNELQTFISSKPNITDVIVDNDVKDINFGAFCLCKNITYLSISDGVTSIDEYAFDSCSSLTSINIPNSVISIGDVAFNGCNNLTSITLPENITFIGTYTFRNCSSLTSINIPNSVISINQSAFEGCSSLTSINIPDSVTSIGDYAFANCSSLTEITYTGTIEQWDSISNIKNISLPSDCVIHCSDLSELPTKSFAELQSYNFDPNKKYRVHLNQDCMNNTGNLGSPLPTFLKSKTNIVEAIIDEGVTKIGNVAFYRCSSLKSVNIPDSVTSIGNVAFNGCSSLTSATIGNGVTSIGRSTFGGCRSLASINIPNGVTSIGDSAFYQCSSLTSINIPDKVTSIGQQTFYGCSSLTSATIGNGVTSIGRSTFGGCRSLASINIPNGVTSIGEAAFKDCSKLIEITYTGTKEQWNAIQNSGKSDIIGRIVHCTDGDITIQ